MFLILPTQQWSIKSLPEEPIALCISHYGPYEKMPETFVNLYAYAEANGYTRPPSLLLYRRDLEQRND